MKTLLLPILLFALSIVDGLAQGTFWFANNVPTATPPVNAPIFCEDGTTRVAGPDFLARLYARPAGSSGAFEGAGEPAQFLTGTGAGYWLPGMRTANNIIPGTQAEVVVRIWRVADGATWEEAAANGRGWGQTAMLTVTSGGAGTPPSLPANLVGLTGISGVPCAVPEPNSRWIAALFVIALVVARTRGRS